MIKKYQIVCEMDFDYLKEVGVQEIFPDGSKGICQALPISEGSYTQNDYDLEIEIPEITTLFGIPIPKIQELLHKINEFHPEWLKEVGAEE